MQSSLLVCHWELTSCWTSQSLQWPLQKSNTNNQQSQKKGHDSYSLLLVLPWRKLLPLPFKIQPSRDLSPAIEWLSHIMVLFVLCLLFCQCHKILYWSHAYQWRNNICSPAGQSDLSLRVAGADGPDIVKDLMPNKVNSSWQEPYPFPSNCMISYTGILETLSKVRSCWRSREEAFDLFFLVGLLLCILFGSGVPLW